METRRNAGPGKQRIILIRHGRPALPVAPRTCHRGFGRYIDDYEQAGLDPADVPPEQLRDLVNQLPSVFTSDRKRAHESAKALAPNAELMIDPLFVEAPLARPLIPLLRMRVTKWAVVARVLWHAGHHPGIETYRKAKQRASCAADILTREAHENVCTALIAHGYFNFLIGRELRKRGFQQSGSHRARFWNAVVYERR
ncbi:MAG: histidine phosphatase family protein [Alphaproteobacteria bacterium]|nr:histidine phosphatase family protein [Alphaproteobacteria bacterium]